jgi:hypothetical protein
MKYKLTNNKKQHDGRTLYQIKATTSFGSVMEGELGGYIENEDNLSQEGNAWVYGDARVYGDAQVSGNARVCGDAWVYGKLKLLSGVFFGIRYKKEEIKYVPLDEDYELIYKGEAKFGDDNSDKKAQILAKIEELKKEAELL